jgi:hypothetical protein
VKKAATLYETTLMEVDNEPQDRLPAEEGRFVIWSSRVTVENFILNLIYFLWAFFMKYFYSSYV